MGYKEDQNYFPVTYRPQSSERQPPPLPPRGSTSIQSSNDQPPPPYTETEISYHSQPLTHSWSAQDPRSSSTQSLVPVEHARDDKRTLLLIYIHGFMGNETSFQSFPAHVHNLATVKLANTHHVHTKLYPRYKSRKPIEYARDDFSTWLRPHESPKTDVVLLGHSMGGLLSAEVALLESHTVQTGNTLRHRIAGTINFDTPFLGMHPGVVVSGIGSLFRPAPDTPGAATSGSENQELRPVPLPDQDSRASSILALTESGTSNAGPSSPLASPVNDPNYNPPFPNDVRMTTRTGWGNALHFINKHSDSLARATRSYVTSYFEFGGCLADYNGLKDRYARLRTLEEADSRRRNSQRRVRFVNYYTASTGRPKKPKLPPRDPQPEASTNASDEARNEDLATELQSLTMPAHEIDPPNGNLADNENELHHDSEVHSISDDGASSGSNRAMTIVDAAPISDSEHHGPDTAKSSVGAGESDALSEQNTTNTKSVDESSPTPNILASTSSSLSLTSSLPPIPAEPQAPPWFDPSLYPEKDARKLAEKEHSRQTKTYERAVKDRDKAIKDRRKLLEKREKTAKQALEKQLKLEAKEVAKAKKDAEIESSKKIEKAGAGESSKLPESEGAAKEEVKPPKPKKDKKFCMLPPKINGEKDPCWVRVYMPGVDEVGAHCGLFFVGEQYEWLVDDVGRRIEEWIL